VPGSASRASTSSRGTSVRRGGVIAGPSRQALLAQLLGQGVQPAEVDAARHQVQLHDRVPRLVQGRPLAPLQRDPLGVLGALLGQARGQDGGIAALADVLTRQGVR
jgi:hypothetical protein